MSGAWAWVELQGFATPSAKLAAGFAALVAGLVVATRAFQPLLKVGGLLLPCRLRRSDHNLAWVELQGFPTLIAAAVHFSQPGLFNPWSQLGLSNPYWR